MKYYRYDVLNLSEGFESRSQGIKKQVNKFFQNNTPYLEVG